MRNILMIVALVLFSGCLKEKVPGYNFNAVLIGSMKLNYGSSGIVFTNQANCDVFGGGRRITRNVVEFPVIDVGVSQFDQTYVGKEGVGMFTGEKLFHTEFIYICEEWAESVHPHTLPPIPNYVTF